MTLGVAIMAHPARREPAEALSAKIGAPVHWDDAETLSGARGRVWSVGVGAWRLAASQGHPWSMVVQDDAVVCEDFTEGMVSALSHFTEGGLVSAYLGAGRPDQAETLKALQYAKAHGLSWATKGSLHWGVAIAMPTELVEDVIAWGNAPRHAAELYDGRIKTFFREKMKWRCWYMVPSLVDHAQAPSLISNDNATQKRVAHDFIGEHVSALSVDWSLAPMGGFRPTL